MDGTPARKMRRIVDDDDDDELPAINDPAFLNRTKASTPQLEVKEDEDSEGDLFSGDEEDEVKPQAQSPSKKRY
jgi:hypothetical protein